MKRVLLTGATGFIGAHAIEPLRARGFEIHTLGRRPAPGTTHHLADLMDPPSIRTAVHAVRATHLLHLAWYVEPGKYWRSPLNLDWVAASLHLARAFTDAGGTRLVAAGTCAEYAWGADPLPEHAPLAPATLYGAAKDSLRRLLEAFGRDCGVSIAWGRLFYLYGPGEPPNRLVSDAIRLLLAGRPLETTHGRQRRDFMHAADAAAAFAALLDSALEGAVNIASGEAPAVRDVLETIAANTGGHGHIDFGARALAAAEPPVIRADVTRLQRDAGFAPRYTLDEGIADTVSRWRSRAAAL